jgi:uncharacterized membrane protein YfcA
VDDFARFAAAGLLVGSLVGFSGMGAGSLMTPLLIALGLPAPRAIGTDLVYSALTKALGSVSHARKGHVDWRIALWLAVGSVPASVVGVFTLNRLREAMGPASNVTLEHLLGVMLIVAGASVAFRVLRRQPREIRIRFELDARHKVMCVCIGVVGGFAVGLTSVGSGSLFGVFLLVAFPLLATRVVGTDILHATLLVVAAGITHAATGNVSFSTVVPLLAGSLPGVWFGSQLTGRIPERPARGALAAVLVLSGSLLL